MSWNDLIADIMRQIPASRRNEKAIFHFSDEQGNLNEWEIDAVDKIQGADTTIIDQQNDTDELFILTP